MRIFELLSLGNRFDTGDGWGVRALDLLRMVLADIFSLLSTEPATAAEISDGLPIMSILRRAKEIRELAHP